MKKLRILSLVMALALCFGLLAGCGGKDTNSGDDGNQGNVSGNEGNTGGGTNGNDVNAPADAFKIGGIGPLTGDAAIYGTNAMNGAQIAVDEINALGGMQFVLNAQDDEHDGEKSVNAYNNLKDWGMQLLVGTVTSNPSLSVSPLAYQDRIFMLTPSASSTETVSGKDNVYQVCFTDPNQGFRSAEYIDENMDVSKIAIIWKNDDTYSQGIRDSFVGEAAARNMEIVYEGTFTDDTQSDFSVQLAECQSRGADLVYLPMYYTPAAVILNQANAMNYAPIFFGVDGMDGILTVKGFNTSLAEGVMLLSPFAADAKDDRTQAFVAEYQKRHNETPNQFAADGYDAVYILYAALQAANCTPDMSAEEINDAVLGVINEISVDGLTGLGMTWAEDGTVNKDPRAVIIENGVYATP